MSLKQDVERFVALKRSLGFKYESEERWLLSWADFTEACGQDIICTQTMIRWSEQSPSQIVAHKRLSIGRQFALWLQAEDQRHEVPNLESVGRFKRKRRLPCVLSNAQIQILMDAALEMPPTGSITPHTMHCIIGLMAVTGIRRAEACALQLSDVTEDGLVIRATKFAKSRLVPVLDTTCEALHHYADLRKRLGGSSDHLFVFSAGRPISPDDLTCKFIKLARTTGLRGDKGQPGVTLHDLRHRFAVTSIEQMVATDRDDVSRHILALSTYLGHVNVSSTYWYLHATPLLLQQISETTEDFHLGRASS